MNINSIASASISLNMSKTLQAVGVSMMKKSMETMEASNAMLIESLKEAVPPTTGQLDIYA